MARILIGDPYPEIRELLVHIVGSMGHEPVEPEAVGPGTTDVDVVIVEPGNAAMLELARRVRRERPTTPCICVSIYSRSEEALALDPIGYLLKPFSLVSLQDAVEQAVARLTARPSLELASGTSS